MTTEPIKINENLSTVNERLAALEAQTRADRARFIQSERKLRVTWAVSCLAAVIAFATGYHKDALAQGYGITLAQAATRIAALETKTASMSLLAANDSTNTSKQPTVRFSGVNVQIVSGTGTTEGTINGTGNLIIGYNELGRANFISGETDVRTGSHNIIVGVLNNYSSYGTVVSGNFNATTGPYAAAFGHVNTASNTYAVVSGGEQNVASGFASNVTGGSLNTASGSFANILGGGGNAASGSFSSVSCGLLNVASGNYSWASGGDTNRASSDYASVSGGSRNTASGFYSSVSGGSQNTASGNFSSVSGGSYVRQTNQYGFSAGGTYSAATPGEGTFHSP